MGIMAMEEAVVNKGGEEAVMPIYEYLCETCGKVGEYLVFSQDAELKCKFCSSSYLKKLLSPSAKYSGRSSKGLPGLGDTGCCGSRIGEASNCNGPGSCCGRA